MGRPKHWKGDTGGIIGSFVESDDLLMPAQFQGGSGTGSGGGSTTATLAPETITYAGSGLVFINTYGSGVSTTFRDEIVAAENYFQSHFINSCTIRCSFDLQSLSPGIAGQNSFYAVAVSYSTFVNALASHATSADDLAAVAALQKLGQTSDPTGGHGVELALGEARVLGLVGASSIVDDAVVLNSYYWSATALQNNPNDVIDVILHEISEGGMGRISSLGIASSYWEPMDFFRYTASGQRDFTGGKDGVATYFSTDGTNVATGLQYHNSVNSSGSFDGYDLDDWDGVGSDANYNDPFGPGGPGAGGSGVLSATDLRIMDVLGWTTPPSPTTIDFGTTGSWLIVGAGDFNHDGTSDVLLRNTSTGAVDSWLMQNGQTVGSGAIGVLTGGWQFAGVGDFNHDLVSDVLLRNTNTGEVNTWIVQNGQWSASGAVGVLRDGWQFAGVGDFNHDGVSDVLLRNANTGEVDTWIVKNGQWSASGAVGVLTGPWQFLGTGDFNGDGTSDVLLRNANTNEVDAWLVQNGQWAASTAAGMLSGNFQFAGTGDFNHDGTDDILLHNSSTGEVAAWLLQNGSSTGSVSFGTFETASQAVAIGDFNHDGKSDVFWQNPSTSHAVEWLTK